jgi:3',5'-nucleoside bisphosphate phosphatase
VSYDLHIHTTASDGEDTPQQVVDQAADLGLEGIAITDHDTLDGLAAAWAHIRSHRIPLEFIPGIELNTDYGVDEVHILGYFIDYSWGPLGQRLQGIRQARFRRAESMIAKLQATGINITLAQVQGLAQGDLIGRPHVARALLQRGYVSTEGEAFKLFIGRGCPGYVPRYKFTPAEAISLVKEAHGVAVLAHPGSIGDAEIIDQLIGMGIEGLEVYYPEHSPEQIGYFQAVAQAHHLLITGGSDYHGANSGENRSRIGLCGIKADMMGDIRRYQQRKRGKI